MPRLEFYVTEDGKIPVEEFMIGLENKIRTKAIRELMLFADRRKKEMQ